jgi:hypothetical protein
MTKRQMKKIWYKVDTDDVILTHRERTWWWTVLMPMGERNMVAYQQYIAWFCGKRSKV